MTTSGFYKFNLNDGLLFAPNGVYAPGFTLLPADHENHTYPMDGWHWFDSRIAAESFFSINGQSSGPNYITFWDATLTSAVYQALYAYANVNLPTNTALTAFIAAFQDAKEGRPNPAAIQQCIFLIMGAAQSALTAEHLGELQALLVAHHMSSTYTLVVPE